MVGSLGLLSLKACPTSCLLKKQQQPENLSIWLFRELPLETALGNVGSIQAESPPGLCPPAWEAEACTGGLKMLWRHCSGSWGYRCQGHLHRCGGRFLLSYTPS